KVTPNTTRACSNTATNSANDRRSELVTTVAVMRLKIPVQQLKKAQQVCAFGGDLSILPEAGSRKPEAGSRKPQASSLKPQASSLEPQASSLKPHASSLKLPQQTLNQLLGHINAGIAADFAHAGGAGDVDFGEVVADHVE